MKICTEMTVNEEELKSVLETYVAGFTKLAEIDVKNGEFALSHEDFEEIINDMVNNRVPEFTLINNGNDTYTLLNAYDVEDSKVILEQLLMNFEWLGEHPEGLLKKED